MRLAILACFVVFAATACTTDAPAGKPGLNDLNIVAADFTCTGAQLVQSACVAGTIDELKSYGGDHIALSQAITYTDTPPASGPHRATWGKWGEFKFLPPQRWLHNLEHGGVALLYDPCAPASVIQELRDFAKKRPADKGGLFRYVMTPYGGLPYPVMAITWQWRYGAQCVTPADLEAFVQGHYRQAPEDEEAEGTFADGWLGR